MRGIASLARETEIDPGEWLPVDEFDHGLGRPFRLFFIGEVNCGKSTLINALCGHDLCKVNVLPETDHVIHYRFGGPAGSESPDPLLENRSLELDFLSRFELIDTPGTNAHIEGHQDRIRELAPTADLLVFAFPVSNPWTAATWNFISSLPPEVLERAVLIIQQADQRGTEDLRVILGHVADLARKRTGVVPPAFAVSAKIAREARRSNPASAELLTRSGLLEFENFISQNVCLSNERQADLESWRKQTATALRQVEDCIEDRSRSLNIQDRFMDDVAREIDGIRETFVTRLPKHLENVAEVFETEGIWVTRILRHRLGALRSFWRLFVGDRTGAMMEATFVERLQAAVKEVAETDGTEVVDACRAHWDELGQRVEDAVGIAPQTSTPIDEMLATAKERFVLRIGDAARDGIGHLKVRNQLDKELRSRNRALKSFTFMTLLLTTAGAICGALDLPWAPLILCSLATLFLIGGVLAAWFTRAAISREFQSRLLDTCGTFATTLRADYEEALRVVFQDYASSLDRVRTHLAREKLAIEPRQRRWQELFLTLKAIEQDL